MNNFPFVSQVIWQPSLLRMTVFCEPDFKGYRPNQWVELVGEAPENVSSQPRTGESLEEGTYEGAKLLLQTKQFRLDLAYIVAQNPLTDTDNMPTLGPFPERTEAFYNLVKKWFSLNPSLPITRIAFGSELFINVGSLMEGYKILSKYLSFITPDEDNSDFTYQINRRRNSKIKDGLIINRLSKWAVLQIQQAMVIPDQQQLHLVKDSYACRLELDINTGVSLVDLSVRQEHLSIFDELITFGAEIAVKGDVK